MPPHFPQRVGLVTVVLLTGTAAAALRKVARCLEAATRQMPRSFSLTTHLLACGLRPLLERIDEMRAYARVACVNLVLLRIVVVQAAQRLRLHGRVGRGS